MGVEFMKAVGKVTAGNRLATTITPISGKEATVTAFRGKAAFSKDSYTAVIWKYDPANPDDEVYLHVEKGSGDKHPEDIQKITGDGTSKLAVVCANSEATKDLFMDCYATVQVED